MKERPTTDPNLKENLKTAPGIIEKFPKTKDFAKCSHLNFDIVLKNNCFQNEIRVAVICKNGHIWWTFHPQNRKKQSIKLAFSENTGKVGKPILSQAKGIAFYIYPGWYTVGDIANLTVSNIHTSYDKGNTNDEKVRSIGTKYKNALKLIRELEKLTAKADSLKIDIPLQRIGLNVLKEFIWFEKYQLEYANKQKQFAGKFTSLLNLKLPARKVGHPGCPKGIKVIVALENDLTDILKLGQRVKTELRTAIKNKTSNYKKLPVYDMSKVRIGKRGFYCGKEPVMLLGPLTYASSMANFESRSYEDFNNFRSLGFNCIRVDQVENWYGKLIPKTAAMRKKGKKLSYSDGEKLLWKNRYCNINKLYSDINKANLFGAVLCIIHERIYNRSATNMHVDGVRKAKYESVDYDNPEILKSTDRIYTKITRETKKYPNIKMILTGCESKYRYGLGGTLRSTDLAFRKYLKNLYGSLEKLNKTWGTNFKSFEQIKSPSWSSLTKGRNRLDYCLRYDWLNFSADRAAALIAQWDKLIKKINPAILATAGYITPLLGFSDTFYANLQCADREKFFKNAAVICFDEHEGQDRYISFLNNLYPEKPLIDEEFHTPCKSIKYMRDHIWIHFLRGLDKASFWVWSRSSWAKDRILKSPSVLYALGKTSYEMRALAKHLIHFPENRTEVGIFFNNASYYNYTLEKPTRFDGELSKAFYRNSSGLDTRVSFVTASQIDCGKLKKYKFLVIPHVNYLLDKTLTEIKQFVKSGGTVLVTMNSLNYDPYLNKRSKKELSDFLGFEYINSVRENKEFHIRVNDTGAFRGKNILLKGNSGAYSYRIKLTNAQKMTKSPIPYFTLNKYGKGKVYYLAHSFKSVGTREVFDAIYTEAKVKRRYRIVDKKGKPEIISKTFFTHVKNKKKVIVGLVSSYNKVNISGFAPKTKFINALTGQNVGRYNRLYNYHTVKLDKGCALLVAQK